MKMKKNKIFWGLLIMLFGLSSCENQDQDFPDFDYQTVYFATQYAMRIVELGEDDFVDNSMDNQHKVQIKATMGGVYSNSKRRIIDFKIENSLCDNLYFKGTNVAVTPMPTEYYQLASNQITITSGNIQGGVEVQLTDAFFEDEKTLNDNYVIPLVMTNVQGADSILQGKPDAFVDNPDRLLSSDWSILPKDYILYGIKYVNPWHGVYLRRGIDIKTMGDADAITVIRRAEYVEKDEIVYTATKSLQEIELPLTTKDELGTDVTYNLRLQFADDGTCSVKSSSDDFTISGTGKFVSKGEKNSMGGKDRNAIYLDYTVDFKNQNMKYATKDTLVLRERGVYGADSFEIEKR